MKKSFSVSLIVVIASTLLCCGADTDVTASPDYNFAAFAGTVWKTKVKVAVADVKEYTGKHDLNLLVPKRYDPAHPQYTPLGNTTTVIVLPVGTCVRIDRLMKDNGEWGGVYVTAKLEDGTNSEKNVRLDPILLANNHFTGGDVSTNWDVNPDMLEK